MNELLMIALSCTSQVMIPASYVSGNCTNGQCTAYQSNNSLSINGNCGNQIQFNATTYLSGSFLTGSCIGGSFSSYVPGAYLDWRGQCSNRGNFHGTMMTSGNFIRGYCTPNGSLSIYLAATFENLNGECTEPPPGDETSLNP